MRVHAEIPGSGTIGSGWMTREDIVTRAEFRRVTGWWPLMTVTWPEALNGFVTERGVKLRIEMEANGSAIRNLSDPIGARNAGYGVYWARGIFLVWPDRWPADDEGWLEIMGAFRLDIGRHEVQLFSTALRVEGDRAPDAISVFRNLGGGCKDGPLVDVHRKLPMPVGATRG